MLLEIKELNLEASVSLNIHKDIFACLFSIHNVIISLSCHEQVCLSGPLKHTCSWHDKLIITVSLKFKFPYLQHLQGRKVNQTLARSLSLSVEI